jgi:hypothetical protein
VCSEPPFPRRAPLHVRNDIDVDGLAGWTVRGDGISSDQHSLNTGGPVQQESGGRSLAGLRIYQLGARSRVRKALDGYG